MTAKRTIITIFWSLVIAGFGLPNPVYRLLAAAIRGRPLPTVFADNVSTYAMLAPANILTSALHSIPFVLLAVFSLLSLGYGLRAGRAVYHRLLFGVGGASLLLLAASLLFCLGAFLQPRPLSGLIFYLFPFIGIFAMGLGCVVGLAATAIPAANRRLQE